VGGALAVFLMTVLCLLLEDAFLFILSTTSVNECDCLVLDAAEVLDCGSSSPSDSFKSSSLSFSVVLDVFDGDCFLLLEVVAFVILLLYCQ